MLGRRDTIPGMLGRRDTLYTTWVYAGYPPIHHPGICRVSLYTPPGYIHPGIHYLVYTPPWVHLLVYPPTLGVSVAPTVVG